MAADLATTATSRLDELLRCPRINLKHISLRFKALLMACEMILLPQRYTRPKNAHLQLHRDTNIPYSEMLFFDDCLWTDNCAMVAQNCPGVVTQATPKVSQSLDHFCILSGNSIIFLTVIICDFQYHPSFLVQTVVIVD